MNDQRIEDLRDEIDCLDQKIVDLLNRRMDVAKRIGEIKGAHGRGIIDLKREEGVLERLSAMNTGSIPDKTLRGIYREIFSASRNLQSPLTVAYLGPEGTFTHEASMERFGQAATYVGCSTVFEIFDLVEQGGARFGVVPIENSIEGSVRETLDRLMISRTPVCGEISLQICHTLVNLTGAIEDIRRVVSHPQALAQCRQWLASHLPGIGLEETTSTARAAQKASLDTTLAAVANERAAVRFGLQVVRTGIQDKAENITRFLVLGDIEQPPTGNDRTALVFWTEDRPGALHDILGKFARYGLNLSRILSRPDKNATPWKYAFFVDVEGHRDDPKVSQCLKELGSRHTTVKVLGSFPIHRLLERT